MRGTLRVRDTGRRNHLPHRAPPSKMIPAASKLRRKPSHLLVAQQHPGLARLGRIQHPRHDGTLRVISTSTPPATQHHLHHQRRNQVDPECCAAADHIGLALASMTQTNPISARHTAATGIRLSLLQPPVNSNHQPHDESRQRLRFFLPDDYPYVASTKRQSALLFERASTVCHGRLAFHDKLRI